MPKTYYKHMQFGSIRVTDKDDEPLAVFSDDAIFSIFVAGVAAGKDELFDKDAQRYIVGSVDKLVP